MNFEIVLRAAPTALLLSVVTMGGCDDINPVDYATLLTTHEEPAGSNCTSGGSAISAGRDRDADGTLADSEIESTVYACRPSSGRSGDTITGSVSIWNQGDIDALLGVVTITGDLVIEADRIPTMRFSDLVVIGGAIRLGGTSGVDTIEFPELTTVGQIYGEDTGLGIVSFPKLTTIYDDAILIATTTIAMPALTNVELLDFTIDADEGEARVELDDLVTAESLHLTMLGETITLEVPALESLSLRGTAPTDVSLYVRASEDATLSFPALTTAGHISLASGSFAFPELETVEGHLRISATSISIPALTTVTSSLRTQSLASISAPSLATVGTLFLGATNLEAASFPALATVTGTCNQSWGGCGIVLMNTKLTEFELPALTALAGDVLFIQYNVDLTDVSFPSLGKPTNDVDVDVTVNESLDSCELRVEVASWTSAGWTGAGTYSNNENDLCAG